MSEDKLELRLDSPLLVRWEFASEERLGTRNAIYRQLIEGVNAEDLVVEAVCEARPETVLDVGCGPGEVGERIVAETGAALKAIDTSERMVSLSRERGLEATVADAQALPFPDASFDCVLAGWVLYHVANRGQALAECARVLRPDGRFVAATVADENLGDLWDLLGASNERRLTFSSANGAEQVAEYFDDVEVREAHGVVVFPDAGAMRRFAAADITRSFAAANVPELTEPFRARSHHTVFVGRKRA
ncbi:MAG TPA: class I SAM-dependent methyltransferase [Gaiellaceae bacterium]|jgi:SAM-dependent methyltransferase|nr:class I SAM-dependent methyltransferase [Gaiellaceae bacterium]